MAAPATRPGGDNSATAEASLMVALYRNALAVNFAFGLPTVSDLLDDLCGAAKMATALQWMIGMPVDVLNSSQPPTPLATAVAAKRPVVGARQLCRRFRLSQSIIGLDSQWRIVL